MYHMAAFFSGGAQTAQMMLGNPPGMVTTTVPSSTDSLTSVAVACIPPFMAIIGAIISYILHTRMKNQEAAAVLDKAIQNSLGLVQGALTNNPDTSKAVSYVLSKPDAVKRIGVSPAEIDQSIKARLESKIQDAQIAADITPTPSRD